MPNASEKKLIANRENSLRSCGPRTPQGKAASSRNALRHGIMSTAPVIPGETAEAWQSHLELIMEAIEPRNGLEMMITQQIAHTLWRLHRVARFELEATHVARRRAADVSLRELERGGIFTPEDLQALAVLPQNVFLDKAMRYEAYLDRRLEKLLSQIVKLRGGSRTVQSLVAVFSEHQRED